MPGGNLPSIGMEPAKPNSHTATGNCIGERPVLSVLNQFTLPWEKRQSMNLIYIIILNNQIIIIKISGKTNHIDFELIHNK